MERMISQPYSNYRLVDKGNVCIIYRVAELHQWVGSIVTISPDLFRAMRSREEPFLQKQTQREWQEFSSALEAVNWVITFSEHSLKAISVSETFYEGRQP